MIKASYTILDNSTRCAQLVYMALLFLTYVGVEIIVIQFLQNTHTHLNNNDDKNSNNIYFYISLKYYLF